MEKVNPNVRGTPFGVSFRGGMMFTGFFGDLSQRTKKGKYIHILIHIYIYSHNKNRNDNRFHTMMAFNLIVVASNLIAMASKLLEMRDSTQRCPFGMPGTIYLVVVMRESPL